MKITIITILLLNLSVCAHAQFKVLSNGRVTVASTATAPAARITVGDTENAHTFNMGISAKIVPDNSDWSVGLYGCANSTTTTQGRACGVFGFAENGASGQNYGVYGLIGGSKNGAGILGSVGLFNNTIGGKYAGYFNGSTRVVGNLTANSFTNASDGGLLTNVFPLSDEGSSLSNILSMNVVSYNYEEDVNTENPTRHYGLIAQELQEIYPDLVKKGEDGFLVVNYVELVPILIRSIQELKQELDEVKGKAKDMRRSASNESADFSAVASGNVLYQNTPNPFKEQTIIRFSLADDVRDASICIFDMTGKTLKKLPISSEMESVSIGGYELGEGMFLYSLIVSGQVIDTKRMVISK